MKAWQVRQHGGLEALEQVELPEPEAGPLEVKIRVQAVGLNHLDIWVRRGVTGHKFPLPMIPGCDVAGQIVEFGAGAADALKSSGLGIGSDVVLNPGISCGHCEACLSGMDPLCREYGIPGETQDGGCCEFVVAKTANIIARPKNITASQAAALPIPFLTAWSMLVKKTQLRPGEVVLIQAGGSSVSIAAIQIAKLLGAVVITTVGSDDKTAKAQALGADHVINYRAGKFRDALKNILPHYGKKGCDVVIDHVGADTMADSLKSLAWGGRLATCGATSGAEISLDLKAIFFKNISIFGTTMGSKADFIRIVELVAQGKLKPVIDSELPMSELKRAHERLESRRIFGKVVVVQ
jgi:NADPH:quinone reductase-like Zn-dependent oxidoreductase